MRLLVLLSLLVPVLVLPLQFFRLPLGTSLTDLANLVTLPVCWVYLARTRQTVRLPYLSAVALIGLASVLACITCADPLAGLGVLLKEIYLYVWLVTLAAVLASLGTRDLQCFLLAWCTAACLNGAVILAQFYDPTLQPMMSQRLQGAGLGLLDPSRPSGLLRNCNAAGAYQLMTFVPLVLLRAPIPVKVLAGLALLIFVLGTGSMGALTGFGAGLVAGAFVLPILRRDWKLAGSSALGLLIGVVAALGLLSFAASNTTISERLDYLLLDRGEGSADSRFLIWERGVDAIFSELSVWGIGPEHFVRVDHHELHNDMLAFTVERGFLGTLSLAFFWLLVFGSSLRAVAYGGQRDRSLYVLPAAIIAIGVESLTHEVFHMRQVWLVFAIQYCMLLRLAPTGTATSVSPTPTAISPGQVALAVEKGHGNDGNQAG